MGLCGVGGAGGMCLMHGIGIWSGSVRLYTHFLIVGKSSIDPQSVERKGRFNDLVAGDGCR